MGLLAFAGLLQLFVWAHGVEGNLFPNRFAPMPCSLLIELEENCQVKSSLGKNTTSGSFKGLLMFMGETNCTVTLQQCYPSTCYSFRDLTAQLPTDSLGLLGPGLIKDFKVLKGGGNVRVTREGVAFESTSDRVTINYSTVTCDEFYRHHGRLEFQLCNQPLEAITPIDTRGPNALDCGTASS